MGADFENGSKHDNDVNEVRERSTANTINALTL